MHRWRPRLVLAAIPPLLIGTVFIGLSVGPVGASPVHKTIDCQVDARCLEVQDWKDAGFEYYVGHDEPSLLFYSNRPGSGSNSTYHLTLPTEPAGFPNASGSSPVTWDFQLHPAFWFGMIICNRDSWPATGKDCTNPPSDANITSQLKDAPGQAFLELQFYPPGWFPTSCTAKRWCVAMVIWSLAENPITGQVLNPTCTAQIGGLEYPNLAYLTKSGSPSAPPNPTNPNFGNAFTATSDWLLMNQGDNVTISIHDSSQGLMTEVHDVTSGQTGSMTASAANGFGGVDFQPSGSACNLDAFNMHPEYSTSRPPTMVQCPAGVFPNVNGNPNASAKVCTAQDGTRVQWAAHSYNISYSDEVGHWDWCSNIIAGRCTINAKEGPGLIRQNDGDSGFNCFYGNQGADFLGQGGSVAGSDGTGVPIPGCLADNNGFDGGSYIAGRWAPAPTAPTPITFSSPTTGGHQYQQAAYEADIPRITGFGATVSDWNCSRVTGTQVSIDQTTGIPHDTGVPCAVPPKNDLGGDAFYPTFGRSSSEDSCMWQEGNYANPTTQYGQALFKLAYIAFGAGGTQLTYRFNDVRHFASSGCGVGGGDGGDGGGDNSHA